MSDIEINENNCELKENQNIKILICVFCGSNLKLNSLKQKHVICEYCGNQNIIKKQEESKFKSTLDKAKSLFEKKSTNAEKEAKRKQKEENKKIKTELKQEKKEKLIEEKRIKEINKLNSIIDNYINIPGVWVDREEFLKEYLSDKTDNLNLVIEKGPIEAGINEKILRQIGENLIIDKTSRIKNLILYKNINTEIYEENFYEDEKLCLSLKLAQELVYLYGVKDIKCINNDKVRKNLISYLSTFIDFSIYASYSKELISASLKAKNMIINIKDCKIFTKKKVNKNKKYTKKVKQKKKLKSINPTKIKNKLSQKNKFFNKENLKDFGNRALNLLGCVTDFEGLFSTKNVKETISSALAVIFTKPKAMGLLKNLEDINFYPAKDDVNDEDIEILEEDYKVSEQCDEFEQIKKYKELLDIGAISDEDFESLKKKILKI